LLALPIPHKPSVGASVRPRDVANPQDAFSSTATTAAVGAAEGAGIIVEDEADDGDADGVAAAVSKLPVGDRVEQDVFLPFSVQVHDHGPLPLTPLALPLRQRSLLGALSAANSEAAPQTLLVAAGAATAEAVSVEAGMEVGVDDATGTAPLLSGAVQPSVSPPSEPVQFHCHGPTPVTRVGLPLAQRFSVGASATPVPFALPHEPAMLIGASQDTGDPPFAPLQVHDHGPEPLTDED